MNVVYTSPYVYGPAGHVITANLRIIGNKHIHRLLIKGPLYREHMLTGVKYRIYY